MTTTATAPETTAAQEIRKIMKASFPTVKFSITSDYNSVRIKWTDGPTTSLVDELTADYAMGSFNSTEDIYEYNNRNNSLPQVKYIFTERSMSEAVGQQIATEWGITDPNEYNERLQCYGSHLIYRRFQETAY